MTGEQMYDYIRAEAEKAAQQAFNTIVKPKIAAKMRALKVVRIQNSMGFDFYTLKNGKTYIDREFSELSQAKAELVDMVNCLQQRPIDSLFIWDIDLEG